MTSGQPSAFGVLLRRHRTAAGLTQEELAERAGISLRGLVALENGERLRPRRDTVRLLADALRLGGDGRLQLEAVSRGRDAAPPLPERSPTPLVGRARELELLEWHLAGLGPPVLVFAGEPGIGKTRLLRQAAEMAGRQGQVVVAGGCQRRSGQEPYAPFPHAIARYLTGLPVSAREKLVRESRQLVRLLPELAPLLPESPASRPIEAGQERRLLFDAVAQLLAHLAGDTGTVLVLDDLQWAPVDALDLLTALSHDAPGSHLRVVCAYRSTDVRPADPLALMLADLAHAGFIRQASVEALSPPEAEQLLTGLAGDLRVPGEMVQRAVARTGGVPFYLVSYAQELRTKGAVADSDVPWDVAHSVRQRAAALPEESQMILPVAAITGRVVSQAVLEHVMGWNDEELLPALETVCRAHLLEETGARGYRFPHDVIRDVIEAGLGSGQRALLHRRVGDALERLPEHSRQAAELAWHFLEAGDADRALHYSLRAADEAARVGAFHEQAALLGQAIQLAGEHGRLDVIPELRVHRGRAFFALTAWPEARHELDEALAGLPSGPTEVRFHALLYASEVYGWTSAPRAARRYAEDALALAHELGRNDLVANALSVLAASDTADGEVERGIERYRRAFDLAGTEEGPTIRSGMERFGFIQYWRSDYHDAEQTLRRALDLAGRAGDTTYTARALGSLALSLFGQGRYGEALEVFAQGQAFAREHRTSNWLARTTAMCGGCYLELGDFDRAEALAEEARDIAQGAGFPLSKVSAGVDLLFNFARRGDAGRTEGLIDEVAAGVARSPGPHSWLLSIRFPQAQAEIALSAGNWDAALAHATTAVALARRYGRKKYQVLGATTRARTLVALGRQVEAIRELNDAVELARSIGDPLLLVRAAAELLDVDGHIDLLAEARAAVTRVVSALPDERLTRRFHESEPACRIERFQTPAGD